MHRDAPPAHVTARPRISSSAVVGREEAIPAAMSAFSVTHAASAPSAKSSSSTRDSTWPRALSGMSARAASASSIFWSRDCWCTVRVRANASGEEDKCFLNRMVTKSAADRSRLTSTRSVDSQGHVRSASGVVKAHWTRSAVGDNRVGGPAMRAKQPGSPYYPIPQADWLDKTRELLRAHPLRDKTLVDAALASWDAIFASNIGSLKIGTDIFPSPQLMGSILHELIPLTLAKTLPEWRRERTSAEKDLVFIPDAAMSIEIKTSSHRTSVFGNRSFGIDDPGRGKKAKDGYYLTVNFDKWPHGDRAMKRPEIRIVRFGWIDHTDWVAQVAQSGQQSSLPALVYNQQLLTIFKR